MDDAGLRKRQEAVDFAVANTELEGGEVSAEQRELLARHAKGEITREELQARTFELAGALARQAGLK